MNIKSIKCFFILVLLLVVSGCRKLPITNEFNTIKNSTLNRTGHEVSFLHPKEIVIDLATTQKLSEGITRNEAIGIALKNNPELQAHFETLGVAKSDLEQSGLYTNPDIHGSFWAPLGNTTMELETGASFNISDFWQVPLRKKVQKDILETVTFTILEFILDIMKNTRLAYDNALYTQKRLQILENLKHQYTDLYSQTAYQQYFGLTSDLEKYLAKIAMQTTEIEIIQTKNNLSQAYLSLTTILGVTPSYEPIVLMESPVTHIETPVTVLPSLEQLQNWALQNRPEIMKAHMQVTQFKDMLRLEKAKILSNVTAGITFKKDFDGDRGLGPSFELSTPLFDQNQYQISRAEFLFSQAQKTLLSVQLHVQKEVQTHYIDFINQEKILAMYINAIIPTHEKAIAHVDKFEKIMQLTKITLLQTRIDLYKSRIQVIKIKQKMLNAFSKLERAVGQRLDLFPNNSSIATVQTQDHLPSSADFRVCLAPL